MTYSIVAVPREAASAARRSAFCLADLGATDGAAGFPVMHRLLCAASEDLALAQIRGLVNATYRRQIVAVPLNLPTTYLATMDERATAKVVYVHEKQLATLVQVPREMQDYISDRGWPIVNAPRPIPAQRMVGDRTFSWIGDTLHGHYFASGDPQRIAEYGETLAQRWEALDAWTVVVWSDLQIMTQVAICMHIAGHREIQEALEPGNLPQAATWYSLPYPVR